MIILIKLSVLTFPGKTLKSKRGLDTANANLDPDRDGKRQTLTLTLTGTASKHRRDYIDAQNNLGP